MDKNFISTVVIRLILLWMAICVITVCMDSGEYKQANVVFFVTGAFVAELTFFIYKKLKK